MSAHMKKLPTNSIQIEIGNNKKRVFSVPKEKARGILSLLKEYEIEEAVDWRAVFAKDLENLSESALALKGARAKEGLTQAKLAKLLETSQPNVAQMEQGKREITKPMAKKLASIFNVGYKVFL